MPRCRDCGQLYPCTQTECGVCGSSAQVQDDDREVGSDSGISRRALLGYGGGATLVALLGAGAGWVALFYEQREPEEQIVYDYVDALDRTHFNTVAELFHERSPDDPPTPGDSSDGVSLSIESTEILDRETDIDIDGVTAMALVRAEIRIETPFETTTATPHITVARNVAGDWKIWEDERQ